MTTVSLRQVSGTYCFHQGAFGQPQLQFPSAAAASLFQVQPPQQALHAAFGEGVAGCSDTWQDVVVAVPALPDGMVSANCAGETFRCCIGLQFGDL